MTFFQSCQHYFNRRALISLGAVCAAAIILFLFLPGNGPDPPIPPDRDTHKPIEENDPNGTQGATNSSNGDGENSLTAISGGAESDDVKKTSKDGDQETTIPSSTGEDNKTDGDPLRESQVVNVSINAVPWAKVSIELPEKTGFIKPRKEYYDLPADSSEEISNITPIPGGLRVPIGTTIMLEYGDRKMTFSYNSWKTSKTISHDFLKP